MASLALGPVAAAIYGVLQDPTLLALAPGGVHDDVPQTPSYPFVLYEVSELEARGFGTGGLPEVELRVHVFSQFAGLTEAQTVLARAIALLKDQALTVTGYAHCGLVFYDETVTLPVSEIGGVKVHELVARFRIFVEEA